MIEFQREEQIEMLQARGFLVKVIGVGGAGSNVLDQIALDGMEEAELICMNTDVRTLKTSTAHAKVQIGKQLTRGLGAGGDPELGILAAEEAEAEIRVALKGQNMVFVCTGLGGGTGSGAAPTISRIAKEEGAFVVVFATMPFSFEGRRRIQQAETALKLMERSADALITFENDRMGELVLPKEGIQQAFGNADKIISQSVRAITNVVTQPGLIQIGMDDLLTALKNPVSRCLFGYGSAKGKNRAQEALKIALRSPLLDRGKMLEKSSNALVHVVGGSSMSLYEVELLMNEMSKNVGSETQILFGAATDEKMDEHLSVTIISSLTLDELRRHDSAVSEMTGTGAGSSLGFSGHGSTTEIATPRRETRTPVEQPAKVAKPEPLAEPRSVVEELLGDDDDDDDGVVAVKALEPETETGEEEAAANAVAEKDAARRRAEAEREEALTAKRAAEEKARKEAEAERARHEAFLRKKEELRKSEAPERKTEAPESAPAAEPEIAQLKPRATADDLMVQRRKAQEELERKRAELEKLLKLEDEARRRRSSRVKSAAAPAAAPPTLAPFEDLAQEPDLSMDGVVDDDDDDDMDQTQRIPVELNQSPPSPRSQSQAAPTPKSLESRHSSRATATSERPEKGMQAELQLDPLRGRFEKSSPTVMEGENLDVPTFFRRRGKKG